jgi:hypothetical protein
VTLDVTLADSVYRQIAGMAARQRVSVERIVAAALAGQMSGWARLERIPRAAAASVSSRRWTGSPAAEPAPEDRIRERSQPGTGPLGSAGGGVSARKTPDRSGGRSSATVFHTVSTSTLS